MRICVVNIDEEKSRKGFEILFHGCFRGAEIYTVFLSPRISRRKRLKLIKKLQLLKISFAALPEDCLYSHHLQQAGISTVSADECFSPAIAEMALSFAKQYKTPKCFYICGGGFFTVTKIALRLLEETNDVFVSCADFDAVYDACADMCGAVIKASPPKEAVCIYPCDKRNFLCFRDVSLSFSDFSISFPETAFSDIAPATRPALAQILQFCGILGNSEIKTELLTEQNC